MLLQRLLLIGMKVLVDETVNVIMILGFVIEGHPAVIAIGHVDVVTQTSCCAGWIVRDRSDVAILNCIVKFRDRLHCYLFADTALLNLVLGFQAFTWIVVGLTRCRG